MRALRAAAGAGALALGLALAGGGGAQAAIIANTANLALSAAPLPISFGGGAATFDFTAVDTGNGLGAAVATAGTAEVSSFFGDVTDFEAGSTIDEAPTELYGFSPFPTASTIPNSAADDFIGLKFTLNDGVHYGYAEVAGPSLVSFAFESTPGASILTQVPEPTSLALLATGAAALMVRRRRQTTA